MSYLPGKIGKVINYYRGTIDSFTDLLPNRQLKNKLVQDTGNINQAYLQQQNPMKYRILNPS
jgi:hypothetical protein